jgi:glutamate synthase (NADPH/NADH) large chain
MSGGVAWVLDEAGDFATRCNQELVSLSGLLGADEAAHVKELIRRHIAATQSARAKAILDAWDDHAAKFVRVMPNDYRRVLEAQARMREKGLPEEEAVMAAFEENAQSVSRAGGN